MFFSIFCSFFYIFYCKMSEHPLLLYKKAQICQFGSHNYFGKEFVFLLMSLTTLKLLKLLKLQYYYDNR